MRPAAITKKDFSQCSCDISQSAHKRSNNLWRHLSFASSQPVWIVIYVSSQETLDSIFL